MSWTALTVLQAAGLWLAAGALALWFYLHSRQAVRRRVSTLRFWVDGHSIPEPRRQLREPWAFLAQLLFLLLLIMALADPRLGDPFESRSVVIVMDTSVWSQVRRAGESSWIEQERQEATRLLNALPARDRVLLLRTDADVTPVLPFTSDRPALRRAIANLPASSAIADVPRALEMAKAALSGSRLGLIVYVGPGMLDQQQAARVDDIRKSLQTPDRRGGRPQFLLRLVGGAAPVQNRGITGITLQRDWAKPERWHVLTKLRNYGQTATNLVLTLSMNGQPLERRPITLAPAGATGVRDDLVVRQAGLLEAEIGPPDALDVDNRAAVFIPALRLVRVNVITARPAAMNELRAVLGNDPYIQTAFVRPGVAPALQADITIHEGVPPPARPEPNSIWFVSGPSTPSSPAVRVGPWNSRHPVTQWVRTRDVSVRNPATIQLQAGDTVLASVAGSPEAPLIVARDQSGSKSLIIGFDPRASNFPQQSAFPLLMAGAVEWMTHSVQDAAESVDAGQVDLPGPATRVIAPSNRAVLFARKGQDLHLLALQAGVYRVIAEDGERLIPVNTPAMPAQVWMPTAQESAAVEPEALQDEPWDLWRWLVALSLVAIWAEWWLFYYRRESGFVAVHRKSAGTGPLRGPGSPLGWEQPEAASRDR